MGFLVGYGLEQPRTTATAKQTIRPNFINYSLQRISKNLFKIKHWKIVHGTYEDIPNEIATWFVDPPYKEGGQCYPESSLNIDFCNLAGWCMERSGQTIVCEKADADWMNFSPMVAHKGRTGMQHEGIWTNEPTVYDNVQQTLFQ